MNNKKLFQIVGSCAGAQFGSKRLLLFVAFMWSLSTFITPFVASSLHLLVLTRVILGLGEGSIQISKISRYPTPSGGMYGETTKLGGGLSSQLHLQYV